MHFRRCRHRRRGLADRGARGDRCPRLAGGVELGLLLALGLELRLRFQLCGNGRRALLQVGEGDRYLDFVCDTLKPFVDEHLRTLPGRADTGIAGSSMGGLTMEFDDRLPAGQRHARAFDRRAIGFAGARMCAHSGIESVKNTALGHEDLATDRFLGRGAEERDLAIDLAGDFSDAMDEHQKTYNTLTDDEKGQLEYAFKLFQSQLLHGPIAALHDASRGGEHRTMLDAIKKLFRLEE